MFPYAVVWSVPLVCVSADRNHPHSSPSVQVSHCFPSPASLQPWVCILEAGEDSTPRDCPAALSVTEKEE